MEVKGLLRAFFRGLTSLVGPAVLLVAWEVAVRTGAVPRTLIAPPSQVAVRLWQSILDLSLERHALVSIRRVVIGSAIGMSLGITLGIAVGLRHWVSRAIEPTLLTLIPIPGTAWIPLLIILCGIGETSRILLIAISGLCTLFIPTAYGIRAADKNLVELARALGKSEASLIRNVLIPSALPNMLAAMRVTLVAAWTLLIASEVIASSDGLGWLIWDARRFSRPDDMIVGMIALGVLGKLGDSLLVLVEGYVTRYRETYRDVSYG